VTVADPALRRSFIALHMTLGVVIIVESARTLIHAFGALAEHHHEALLGSVEIVAAVLFLWPRTLRIGGWVLVAIFLLTASVHAVRGEFPAPLLVYAAAVFFVTVHGGAWPRRDTEAGA
jgi:hypothetical protein